MQQKPGEYGAAYSTEIALRMADILQSWGVTQKIPSF
jgi:hypothetical protein